MIENVPILAMLFSGIGNVMMSLGAVVQKVGADKAPKIGKAPIKETIKGFIKNRTWLLGVLLSAVGFPMFALAFNFGGLIYTQPMVSIGLLAIVFYSRIILKEKVTLTEMIGIFMIVICPILIAYGSRDIVQETFKVNYIAIAVFYIIIYAIIIVLTLISRSVRQKGKKGAVIFAFITGIFFAAGAFSGRLSAIYAGLASSFFIFLLVGNYVVGTISSQIMYQRGKAIITLTLSNFVIITLPVIVGIMVLNEKINLILSIGIIGIIIGCIIVSKIQSPIQDRTVSTVQN
jgi:drug/metabolite transporter (DMT)-like permease